MNKIEDLSAFIILNEEENHRRINNLRLQRMLFIIQYSCLKCFGHPCFEDDFLLWESGPIVKRIYQEYTIFGGSPILIKNKKDFFFLENRYFISLLLEKYSKYTDYEIYVICINFIRAHHLGTNGKITSTRILNTIYGE